jgi:PhzF family phenazine biosynthesis protein
MSVAFTQVDAFTSEPFRGNPAAVVVLPRWPGETWLQAVAAEMNLSETAFLVARAGGSHGAPSYDLRWFTPTVEVALCGHATLASAAVLWTQHVAGGSETGAADAAAAPPITFHTRSGPLVATRRDGWIELDFPAMPPRPAAAPPGLAAALGVEPIWAGRSRFDMVVEVADETAVRDANPDFARLREVDARGVVLTAVAAPGAAHDFVSRFFAPRVGIDEDPVTGSAHCSLAPFWAQRLGRDRLTGYQASRRGGTVRVRHAGDRVVLAGTAVTVARGELLVDPPA